MDTLEPLALPSRKSVYREEGREIMMWDAQWRATLFPFLHRSRRFPSPFPQHDEYLNYAAEKKLLTYPLDEEQPAVSS